jgi:hypothetical protein
MNMYFRACKIGSRFGSMKLHVVLAFARGKLNLDIFWLNDDSTSQRLGATRRLEDRYEVEVRDQTSEIRGQRSEGSEISKPPSLSLSKSLQT